jgi:hypothetical protein
MVMRFTTILGYRIDNIRGKICDLRALGFLDPVQMIATSPPILGYSIERIRTKLSDLRTLGFCDPVAMVARFPPILGYGRERMLQCGRVVMRLHDSEPRMFVMLINKRREIIDAVAAAEPQSWSDVCAIINSNQRKRSQL